MELSSLRHQLKAPGDEVPLSDATCLGNAVRAVEMTLDMANGENVHVHRRDLEIMPFPITSC